MLNIRDFGGGVMLNGNSYKSCKPLSAVWPGQEFVIEGYQLPDGCDAFEQKLLCRLGQLGFEPENKGICLYWNMGKGSLAFRINGSVIALRREDAAMIQVLCLEQEREVCVMLTGNPNVGKSTLFNRLTGMRQHTGNWPGKTVKLAEGSYRYGREKQVYHMIDLPGTYSLRARSEEEMVTAEALKSREADLVIVVCDASCLERSIRFSLEVMELCKNQPVILCVNLCDEAKRKGIVIHFALLEELIGCRVIKTCAATGEGLEALKKAIEEETAGKMKMQEAGKEDQEGEKAQRQKREGEGEEKDRREEELEISRRASLLMKQVVQIKDESYWHRDYRIDRFLTAPLTGSICMLGMLLFLFWLTICGANYPSELLAVFFAKIGGGMEWFLTAVHCPPVLAGLLFDGIWKVVSWVVSVMLPPMAIFFPLFTIMEDLGYLPRIAFQLDGCFKKCHACGKQALTMCMGLGCNAVGVTGCRIIDTKKERLLALLTNSLIPCNGRFPTLIAVITMFFAGGSAMLGGVLMCGVVVLSVFMTFLVTGLLSLAFHREKKSTFILELPPYRKPQITRILVRSLIDRTAFVLSRAILAAAPAGALIWLLANIRIVGGNETAVSGQTLLSVIVGVLDHPASFIGLDGAILFAFILGFPANEIVLPAVLMCYLAEGSLVEVPALSQLKILLLAHGWTAETALCMLLFTLFHWPCATTCLTIRKETGSFLWTAAAFLIPALCGCILCGAIHFLAGIRIL